MYHILVLIFLFFTLFVRPSAAQSFLCDMNNDGCCNLVEYNAVHANYGKQTSIGDLNRDGSINLADWNLVHSLYNQCATSPTIVIPSPTSIPPGQSQGLWIEKSRLMTLPMSGPAWQSTLNMAQSNWGSPCLDNNDCEHDVKTMAGALVAARTGDNTMRTKVITALNEAINRNATTSRALELSRGLQSYVIAADIIGYRTPEFEDNLRYLMNKGVSGHSGGTGVVGTAVKSANNWGMHARASAIAGALYLNDQQLLDRLVAAHEDIIGIRHSEINYTSTNWHADASNKAGINRSGATIQGKNVSGVIPEDWRRAAEFKWPPDTSGYMWEGMQGFAVETILLARSGRVAFSVAGNPLKRAFDVLYGVGEATQNSPVYVNRAASDDTWLPWLANYYLGTNYPTDPAIAGKGICCTDWTHTR